MTKHINDTHSSPHEIEKINEKSVNNTTVSEENSQKLERNPDTSVHHERKKSVNVIKETNHEDSKPAFFFKCTYSSEEFLTQNALNEHNFGHENPCRRYQQKCSWVLKCRKCSCVNLCKRERKVPGAI